MKPPQPIATDLGTSVDVGGDREVSKEGYKKTDSMSNVFRAEETTTSFAKGRMCVRLGTCVGAGLGGGSGERTRMHNLRKPKTANERSAKTSLADSVTAVTFFSIINIA